MDGIFNVLKPPGMTSFDVVAVLRRALQTKKIGHGGTLDPDAAGVLPVFAGSATRLLEFAVEGSKEYIVEITLGVRTDTGDDSGLVVEELLVPELSADKIEVVLKKFLGERKQLPPMHSAVKINGTKLYQLARQGIEVERKPREIFIHSLKLLRYSDKKLTLAVECSKGTYIRVLGEEIAAELGTCGTMSFLLRIRVAGFCIEVAHTLQEIAVDPAACMQDSSAAVAELPSLVLTEKQACRITSGVKTTVQGSEDGLCALLSPEGKLLGIGKVCGQIVKAEKVLHKYESKKDLTEIRSENATEK